MSRLCIGRIHGATNYTTTIKLRIYNGDMRYYSGDLVDTDFYDKWFRVNLIHDVDKRNLTVFIDGVKKFETKDRGAGDFYFKCGVYAAPANISYYMESSFSNSKGTKSICIKGKFTNTKGNFSNKSNFNIRGNNSSRNKDNTNINECNNNNNKGSIVTNISSIKGSNINTNNSLIYMEKEECCELVLTSECICLLRRRTQSRGVVYFDYQTLLTMWLALSM
ncbi:hypothetical protein CsSME_00035203 [Camellia sinensis var. sinensis]